MATTAPTPASNGGLRAVPPRPTAAPAAAPRPRQTPRTTNATVNLHLPSPADLLPQMTFAVNRTVINGAPAGAGQSGPQQAPGSDFLSNEDIRAFSEYIRKQARNRATDRAMDAEALEARLSQIPDANGSRAGARMRARRVSRHLKKIAAAEKVIARCAVALNGAFELEYETELSTIGRGRAARPNQRTPFAWKA